MDFVPGQVAARNETASTCLGEIQISILIDWDLFCFEVAVFGTRKRFHLMKWLLMRLVID